MRLSLGTLFGLAAFACPATGRGHALPAPGAKARESWSIYSTLDNRLASPLIEAFQADHPDVAVRYEDLLASEIAARVIAETDAGQPTADFLFSSAMDLQLKLANDGYGQAAPVADGAATGPTGRTGRTPPLP